MTKTFNENSTSTFPSPAWDVRKLTKLKYTALTPTRKTKQNKTTTKNNNNNKNQTTLQDLETANEGGLWPIFPRRDGLTQRTSIFKVQQMTWVTLD